jgi:hypothetical protein
MAARVLNLQVVISAGKATIYRVADTSTERMRIPTRSTSKMERIREDHDHNRKGKNPR